MTFTPQQSDPPAGILNNYMKFSFTLWIHVTATAEFISTLTSYYSQDPSNMRMKNNAERFYRFLQ
jgi:hypothetical protein